MIYTEYDETGRVKPWPLYGRVVDVCGELAMFASLVRDRDEYLTDRYSERKAAGCASVGAMHVVPAIAREAE